MVNIIFLVNEVKNYVTYTFPGFQDFIEQGKTIKLSYPYFNQPIKKQIGELGTPFAIDIGLYAVGLVSLITLTCLLEGLVHYTTQCPLLDSF